MNRILFAATTAALGVFLQHPAAAQKVPTDPSSMWSCWGNGTYARAWYNCAGSVARTAEAQRFLPAVGHLVAAPSGSSRWGERESNSSAKGTPKGTLPPRRTPMSTRPPATTTTTSGTSGRTTRTSDAGDWLYFDWIALKAFEGDILPIGERLRGLPRVLLHARGRRAAGLVSVSVRMSSV